MNFKTPAKLLSLLCVGIALTGCATKTRPVSPAVSLGDNTYSVTRKASNGFTHDTDKLKAEATEDAAKFCAEQGRQMKIVTVTDEKPLYTLGYASATVIFKALNAGDPELTAAPAPLPSAGAAATPAYGSAPSAPAYASAPSGVDDLYTELNKLDDLRRRGILTDKEFQAEKKKVLKRSR